MKRIFLIFLMTLLPLQAGWSAGLCRLTEEYGALDYSSSSAAAVLSNEKQESIGFDDFGDFGCCSACHFVCHLPAAAVSGWCDVNIPRLGSVFPFVLAAITYQSHVPDGPTRPNWISAI